uniref:F-box/kelch-repeat protein At3g23880 family n=1 Tax=Cajanus cajan TaxID=3821 RepID=A0A151R928_CAJCA|nr:F-box/kelch-repeat protein At3g23880 family [Cajanus cajan]
MHYDLAVDQNKIAKKIMFFSCFVNEIVSVDVTKPLVAPDATCILRSPLGNSIRYSKIVGTCRGMVLISVPTSMLIWNPSTGFTRSFCPWSATTIAICGDVFGMNLYGFGYDRSEDNYVVLQIYLSKRDTSHRALLYSVKHDSWRDFEDDSLSTITHPSVSVQIIMLSFKFILVNVIHPIVLCCILSIMIHGGISKMTPEFREYILLGVVFTPVSGFVVGNVREFF